MKALAIHTLLAMVWLFLSKERNLVDLAFGFVLGFGILALFSPVLGTHDHVRRTLGFGLWLLSFARAFLVSNWVTLKIVLFTPKDQWAPGFVEYPIGDLKSWEVVVLAQCISLTPGTTSVEVRQEDGTLLIHALDSRDPAAITRSIDLELKAPLLAFTR